MAANDTVHVEMVETFRLLTPQGDPNFVVLRVETQDGKTYNFGLDRAGMAHTVKVWNFDLQAGGRDRERRADSGPADGQPRQGGELRPPA